MRSALRLLSVIVLSTALSACPPPRARPTATSPKKVESVQQKSVAATATAASTQETTTPVTETVLFYAPSPDGNPAALATALENEPRLKITLIFPPKYFEAETRSAVANRFRVLQSSGQIEIALTLDNQPNLALIDNIKNAGPAAEKWGIEFSWPEDVAAQVARGSGAYQKAWGTLPSGFFPPYGGASSNVVDVLRRFRLNWVVLLPSDTWGVTFQGGTAVIVPQPVPMGDESLAAGAIADATAKAVVTRPFAYVDAAGWPSADYETQFLKALTKISKANDLATAAPFVSKLRNEFAFPSGASPFARDFSAWTLSAKQRRAWEALSEARQVVGNYKNSGRANLVRLDAATEEISNAESGPFLLSLGSSTPDPVGQRNFLATIANVYRLAGVPVPANLNTWFAERSVQKGHAASETSDRPFIVAGAQEVTWNDARGDDTGPGTFVYPAGIGPRGIFDLQTMTVSWTDSEVTLAYSTVETAPTNAPMLPVLDLYIDLNRIPDAGTVPLIRQRGGGAVQRDAAWEFAVTISPKTAVVYQGLPGSERNVAMKSVTKSPLGYTVTFPRAVLRGDPRKWRLTAALGATEASNREEAPAFIPVTVAASPKTFGGASPSRQSPPYIDVLAPGSVQATVMKSYETGTAVLPFVDAE